MRFDLVAYVLGYILISIAICMMPSLGLALHDDTPDQGPFFYTIIITLLAGVSMTFAKPPREQLENEDLTAREGFLIVSAGWGLAGVFGAIPFYLAQTFGETGPHFLGHFTAYSNALFETVSGFTTTGASVLTDYDQPRGIMFWRSLTHWLGGMGIIVLSLAILPAVGVGGMQMYRAEVPGPTKDRLKPRISDTAKTLYGVYLLLTVAETILLMFGGMSLYEALCHTFGTVATGGFSTHAQSVGGYNSSYINWVIVVFMLIAGANFALHFRLLRGEGFVHWKSSEFRFYVGIFLFVTFALVALPWNWGPQTEGLGLREAWISGWGLDDWPRRVEHAAFQTAAILTTTGYATQDFEVWHPLACMLLFLLMSMGGCAGSTGGGSKCIRIQLLFKSARREVARLLYPKAVLPVRQDGRSVPEKVIAGVIGFIILFLIFFTLSVLFLSLLGLDFVTAITATASSLGNIGPGLGQVGPTDNYFWMPTAAKLWLVLCMLLGRLEIYSIVVLFSPAFWRR